MEFRTNYMNQEKCRPQMQEFVALIQSATSETYETLHPLRHHWRRISLHHLTCHLLAEIPCKLQLPLVEPPACGRVNRWNWQHSVRQITGGNSTLFRLWLQMSIRSKKGSLRAFPSENSSLVNRCCSWLKTEGGSLVLIWIYGSCWFSWGHGPNWSSSLGKGPGHLLGGGDLCTTLTDLSDSEERSALPHGGGQLFRVNTRTK